MTTKDLAVVVETPSVQADPLEIEHFYDDHPTREDYMAQTPLQLRLINYMIGLLQWVYVQQGWFVGGDFKIFRTGNYEEYPVALDVAFFKNCVVSEDELDELRSWKLAQPGRPAPTVIFEFCSKSTWPDDVNIKPETYNRMGVREYFVYDPHKRPFWRNKKLHLRGWRYQDGQAEELKSTLADGRLWSEELDSWIVPDDHYLRLYDRDGRRRLDKSETQALEVQAATDQAQAALKEVDQFQRRISQAERQTQTEREAKEKAWARLRELGIDPEKL